MLKSTRKLNSLLQVTCSSSTGCWWKSSQDKTCKWKALESSPREIKYVLLTHRIARNGKVGGSSTSLKTWAHKRSTMVTAKLEMDGQMWEPIAAPGICRQKKTLTTWTCGKTKTPVQWGNLLGAWISRKNGKRKCCVGHSWWTSSNRWRNTKWSRLTVRVYRSRFECLTFLKNVAEQRRLYTGETLLGA